MVSDWIVTDLAWLADLLGCLKDSKPNSNDQFRLSKLFGLNVPIWDISKPLENSIDSTKVKLSLILKIDIFLKDILTRS